MTSQDIISFGKHNGKTIAWIVKNEPSYILWLDENGIVKFTEEVVNEAAMYEMTSYLPEEFFWQPGGDY